MRLRSIAYISLTAYTLTFVLIRIPNSPMYSPTHYEYHGIHKMSQKLFYQNLFIKYNLSADIIDLLDKTSDSTIYYKTDQSEYFRESSKTAIGFKSSSETFYEAMGTNYNAIFHRIEDYNDINPKPIDGMTDYEHFAAAHEYYNKISCPTSWRPMHYRLLF